MAVTAPVRLSQFLKWDGGFLGGWGGLVEHGGNQSSLRGSASQNQAMKRPAGIIRPGVQQSGARAVAGGGNHFFILRM